MTELERLQKAVADTGAAFDADFYAEIYDESVTYDAWSKARLKLSDYLKEHGDEHSI